MEKILSLKGYAVGLALLALPFLLWSGGRTMAEQIGSAKLFGCFLLGNLCFSFIISREIHPLLGFAHWAYAFTAWYSGFSPPQILAFTYWSAAVVFSLWFLKQSEKDKKLMLQFVVYGAILSGIYAIIQMCGRDFVFHYAPEINNKRPIAFFGQYTMFGSFMGCVGAMALGLEMIIPWAFIGVMVFCTKSCFSIACFLMGSGIAATHLFPKYKAHFLALIAAGGSLSTLGVLFLQNLSLFYGHGRLDIWKATIFNWWHAPARIFLLGFGPSSFRYIFPPAIVNHGGHIDYVGGMQPRVTYDHGVFLEAHNDFISLTFEQGLIGIIFLAAFIFCLFLVLKSRWWNEEPDVVEKGCQAFTIAVLVNAIGNFPFQQAPHYFLAILSISVVLHYALPTFEWKR